MPLSSFVTPGETGTADAYNSLRHDVLDPVNGHTHNGVEGARINHSDLRHPNNYTPVNTHQAIDEHIARRWGTHGLKTSPAEHFLGVLTGGLTIYPVRFVFNANEHRRAYDFTHVFPNDVRFNMAYPPIVTTGYQGQNLGYVRIYGVYSDRIEFSVWVNELGNFTVTVHLMVMGVLL